MLHSKHDLNKLLKESAPDGLQKLSAADFNIVGRLETERSLLLNQITSLMTNQFVYP